MLQRIRTGIEEVDWVAIVKCVLLIESSIKHRNNIDHVMDVSSSAGPIVLKTCILLRPGICEVV